MVDPRAENHVRLKEAVRRNRAFSREGLLERLFERLFRGLVYTQIWEDPEIDLEALALRPDWHVVAIASGGCNVLSYLTADPARITAVDLSRAHVALNRLKLVAATRLPSWQAFYRLFRRGRRSGERRGLSPVDRAPSRSAEPRLLGEPRPAASGSAADLDLRPQRLSPRRAGPLHRPGPCRRAALRRRPARPSERAFPGRAAALLRDHAGAAVRQARSALGDGQSAVALRARHSAGAIRGAGRRPRHGRGAARPGRAAGLRLQPRRQLLRLAGVRPALQPRRGRVRCRPICGASNSTPSARGSTASRC